MKKTIALLLYAGMLLQPAPTAREALASLQRQAHEARIDGDVTGRLRAVLGIRELLNGAPDIVEASAQAYLAAGDTIQALAALGRYAEMGQADDEMLSGKDSNFLALRGLPQYEPILKRMAMNKTAIGLAEPAVMLSDQGILPEDIDYDPSAKSFLVTSVLEKKIIRINLDGKAMDFASSPSHWPMLAVKVDAAHQLVWATEVALDGWAGVPKADWGQAAVLCFDLRTGVLRQRIEGALGTSLGDMVLTRRGEPIISDGEGGGIYRVVKDSLERIDRGDFISPQTPVPAPDGNRLFVPDYTRGIGILDLSSRKVIWLSQDRYALNGVDGLYYDRGTLLLTQNGGSPERVVRLWLDKPGEHVVSGQIVERATPMLGDPTHGVVVGGSFYYITNSGWDQLDEHGSVKAGGKLTSGRIMRFRLN